MNFRQLEYLMGIFNNNLRSSIYSQLEGIVLGIDKMSTRIGIQDFFIDKEEVPLQYVDSVEIEDSQGLDYLLFRTDHSTVFEWGTVLKVEQKDKTAVIDKIMDPNEAKDKGLIVPKSKTCLKLDLQKIENLGYNGFHHYHPDWGGMNFSINVVDWYKPANWVNLITFNLGDKPEIIAYNRRHVYIPEDKKAPKDKLYKANWKQIYDYLR